MTELSGVLAAIQELCDGLEARMGVLRFGTEDDPLVIPPATAEGHDVHEALLEVRGRLDLAEQLIREARRERRRFRTKAAQRRRERDEEYDRKLGKRGEGAVRREFEGAREREAGARLDVLPLTQQANRAEDARAMVEDCFDGLRDAMFGLLNIREELIARLRELQWEQSMERS
jgi:hypothetical protein